MKKSFTLQRPSLPEISMSGSGLKWAGSIFLTMSILSTTVLQRGVFRLDTSAGQALYDSMSPGSARFVLFSFAVLFSLLGAMALPIYPKLLLEGWKHTGSKKSYALRLSLCALASEPLYDFAMTGKFFDFSAQNPVWAILLSFVMLEIMEQYASRPGAAGVVMKAVVLIASMAWALLLQCQAGPLLVALTALYYLANRWKPVVYIGGVLLTIFQFPAPFGLLFVHWYDGEPGSARRKLFYFFYPVLLLVCGITTALLLRFL